MPDEQVPGDRQLLKEAQAGDPEAFGKLYERYAESIFRFLFAHLDNRMDAEDLTEEVFLKAWRALPKYREKGLPFSAFLFRVANNLLIDHYRSRSKPDHHADIEERTLKDPCPEMIEQLTNDIERQELRQNLRQLKEEYRTVLVARFISDLSPDETAAMMGKSAGAVRVLQHRALAALRKLLDGKYNE